MTEDEEMNGVLLAMQGAVSQGVLWGIMVLGVYIKYKIFQFIEILRVTPKEIDTLV